MLFRSDICCSRGETEKAISQYETALGIASTFNWREQLFWIHSGLARLFFGENKFNDAHAHIERAKPHAVNDGYMMGRAMELRARILDKEGKLEEAKSEALRAIDAFATLGATKDLERSRILFQDIEVEMKTRKPVASGELPETVLLPAPINLLFSDGYQVSSQTYVSAREVDHASGRTLRS